MKKTIAIILVTIVVIFLLSLESVIDKILSIENGEYYLLFSFVFIIVGIFIYLKKQK